MKICIPVENNEGLESKVYGHFGSAPCFLIYDTDKETFEAIDNTDRQHIHGMCHPLKALDNQAINAVICVGMGVRAVQKLNEGGIRAYKVEGKTVAEVIKLYTKGALEEITVDTACTDHECR